MVNTRGIEQADTGRFIRIDTSEGSSNGAVAGDSNPARSSQHTSILWAPERAYCQH
jgi:hypothetical protein